MKKYILYALILSGIGLVVIDHYAVNKYLQDFNSHNSAIATESGRTQQAMHIASDASHRIVKLEDVIDDYKKQVLLLKDDHARTLKSLETSTDQVKELITDNAKLQIELDKNAKDTEELAEKLQEAKTKINEYERAGFKLNFLTRIFRLW